MKDYSRIKDILELEQLIYIEETTSTNDVCRSLFEENNILSALVITDYQSQGRGTKGRKWDTQKGENLMFSLLLQPKTTLEEPWFLTMVMALSVVEALKSYSGNFKIKWPNDIIYEGRKICGILTEACFKDNKLNYIIIGTGINCNEENFSEELSKRAISLKQITGKKVKKEKLLYDVIFHFNKIYDIFLKEGIESLMPSIKRYSGVIGRKSEILLNNQVLKCKVLDISTKGEIIVQFEDGKITELASAEMNVDGIYGCIIK